MHPAYALCAAIAAGFVAIGVLHWTGRWRLRSWVWPYVAVGAGVMGTGALLVLLSTALLLPDLFVLDLLALLLVGLGGVLWLVGMVALFWVPERLRPPWQRRPARPGTSP